MSKVSTAFHLFLYNPRFFVGQLLMSFSKYLKSDKWYLSSLFYFNQGKKLNLQNPESFQEKLQWLKLFDRNPKYIKLVDKYEVKAIVAKIIGDKYIIPTIDVWQNLDEIKWDKLPQKFVLKTTHDGGSCGVVICRDKSEFDIANAIRKLDNSLKRDVYSELREWPYKNVCKRVIAEQYLESLDSGCSFDLSDYKFYCFNGEPIYCQVIRDRNKKEIIDFYDMEWNHMPFVGLNPNCKNGSIPVQKPDCLHEMIGICKSLSIGIPFVRVDLYYIDGSVYFGEMTFYPNGGLGTFSPNEWNNKVGDLLKLPQ